MTEQILSLRHDDLKPAYDASVDQTELRKGWAAIVARPLRETTRSPDAGPGGILSATRRPREICSAS